MNQSSPKKIIWVEKLTCFILTALIIRQCFSDIQVKYLPVCSSSCKRLVAIANRIFCRKWILPIHFNSEIDEALRGNVIYDFIAYLESCFKSFSVKHIDSAPLWFSEMLRTYFSAYWNAPAYFIKQVEHRIELCYNESNINHEIIIDRHPVNNIMLANSAIRNKIRIHQSISYHKSIRFYLAPVFRVLTSIVSIAIPRKLQTNICNTKPCIFMDDYFCDEIINPRALSFWRDQVVYNNFNFVYCLSRYDIEIPKQVGLLSEFTNIYWISLFKILYIRKRSIGIFLRALKTLFCEVKYHKTSLVILSLYLDFALYYWIYVSILSRYNVKLLVQHRDTSWLQVVQAKALEEIGGIMVGFHWSNFPGMTPDGWFSQHVLFVWGNVYYDLFKYYKSSAKYILPSGQWISGVGGFVSNNVSSEDDFTIAVFDSSASFTIWNTPDHLSQFYLFIIKLLSNNNKINAVFKCKFQAIDDLIDLPEGQKIINYLRRFIEQKRAKFLSSLKSPVIAAKMADLSVCFSLNSAGIVCATHGCKAVHWDFVGWREFPIYKDSEQKILYNSLESLEHAIIGASKGDTSIGDFSKWKKEFSYFEPSTSAERVGRFVQNYMEKVVKTNDAFHSLKFAAQKYIEENDVATDFFKFENLFG